ncbi:hypothetical protein [Dysgonomonas sp. ZJ709]|uniref:hypothetical protein n=1 Tax=Dysgonomonas sp. ZJ709 TaxID=2709797 RepID=UPI0013ED0170|nr:hypothetical protein [Dysgonomonas sp. ZJ709]
MSDEKEKKEKPNDSKKKPNFGQIITEIAKIKPSKTDKKRRDNNLLRPYLLH